MSWTTARLAAAGDEAGALVTHVVWSANGSTQSAVVAPTAVTLKSGTTANPSVIANDGALESAAASDAVTISHWAFAYFDDPDYSLQTTWNALTSSAALLSGGKLTVVDGGLTENIHQTASAPS